jgi:hypothetical protein
MNQEEWGSWLPLLNVSFDNVKGSKKQMTETLKEHMLTFRYMNSLTKNDLLILNVLIALD